MIESGDGESQPGEGVVSLSDLASQMDASDEAETPEALPEGEEGDEPEVEQPEGEDEEQEQAEEPTFTIKVDGKDVTLKQSELIELGQKGLDYTKKTMAVAEERKAVETAKAQAEQARQYQEQAATEHIQRLQAFAQFMEKQVGDPPPVEWASQDVAYYLAQKEQYEARKGQLHQALQDVQQLQQQQARKRQAWVQERAAQTEKALRDTLPGWNDDTLNTLADYAGKLGLTPQSAEAAMLEPGFWQLIHRAKQYDALMEQKKTLKPKSELPKVSKPAASNPTPRAEVRKTEAFKNYRAKPSLDSLSKLVD
jgi:hypothetical protein